MCYSKLSVSAVMCGLAALAFSASTASAQCVGCGVPVVAAPAYVTYMPQYAPMPSVLYRANYRPVVAAYQPAYQPVTGYAVTTYRRPFRAEYRTTVTPYTSYMPVYAAAPVVVNYSGCSTCTNYATYYTPSDSCSVCSTCNAGATTYSVPSSGCSSCAASTTVVSPAPYNAASSAAPATTVEPPRTFQQEKVQKPVTEPTLKPIPQTDTTRPSSMSSPSPLLPDPRDRTAVRSVSTSTNAILVGAQLPLEDEDGWRPAND